MSSLGTSAFRLKENLHFFQALLGRQNNQNFSVTLTKLQNSIDKHNSWNRSLPYDLRLLLQLAARAPVINFSCIYLVEPVCARAKMLETPLARIPNSTWHQDDSPRSQIPSAVFDVRFSSPQRKQCCQTESLCTAASFNVVKHLVWFVIASQSFIPYFSRWHGAQTHPEACQPEHYPVGIYFEWNWKVILDSYFYVQS